MQNVISVRGARVHNLKNIDLDIPKNKLVVFTGLSGSGKSSLAFDTIYAEGQRRYVESLSSYARQFLGLMDKPDVESIDGLSPAISIDQKSTSHNPRSTVGTITEIYDYMRLFYARIGHPHCPGCGREVSKQTTGQIVKRIFLLVQEIRKSSTSKQVRLMILSPVIRDRKGEFSQLFDNLRSKGFSTMRVDGHMMGINDNLVLIKTNKHTIDVVIDRLSIDKSTIDDREKNSQLKHRLTEAIDQAAGLSEGLVIISHIKDPSFTFPPKPKNVHDYLYSQRFSCAYCNISIPEIEPRIFSFNSPHGACTTCSGIGSLQRVDPDMILNMNLTITEGAILPFARMILTDTWYGRIILHVAKSLGIRADRPLKEAKKVNLQQLLYGTGDQIHEVNGENRQGRNVTIYETFAGIISEMERRYRETESDYVRNEIRKYLKEETCPACYGKRLKKEALSITIDGKSIVDITDLSIHRAHDWISNINHYLSEREILIGTVIIREITQRLNFLLSVGLDYLTLNRSAITLSGGESQRIRLASQIGSGLTGVLYVLDEPSIGLHQRDNSKLIQTLKRLRDLGNTVIVVEHDRETMEHADLIVDFGPGAGEHGGKIIATGTIEEICKNSHSATGLFLSGKRKVTSPVSPQSGIATAQKYILLKVCNENNLKNIDVSIPLGKLICVTGVSGSGKSTLVVDTLYQSLARELNPFHRGKVGKHDKLLGAEYIRRVILIDQSPIGRTPRSNPATYTGAFTFIRELYSLLPDSKLKGYAPGRFSFNVRGGRCEACEGEGQTKIEMQFLPDVYVTCDVCRGTRFNSDTLEVIYKGKNIAEVLQMTVEEALQFFEHIPLLYTKLETLHNVGLSYIHLGQPAPQLSGGEAQRVKLASELSKVGTKDTVYILDEPTTGLHFADLVKLLDVLKKLVAKGNTVVIIEHNLDVVKNSDWIIDLGPEGGDAGGQIIVEGTVATVAACKSSYTGQYL